MEYSCFQAIHEKRITFQIKMHSIMFFKIISPLHYNLNDLGGAQLSHFNFKYGEARETFFSFGQYIGGDTSRGLNSVLA